MMTSHEENVNLTLGDLVEEKEEKKKEKEDDESLLYTLPQIPPVLVLISSGMQHILMSIAWFAASLIVSDVVCAGYDSELRARLFCSALFVCGICTILQSLIGVRLPIFQGPSASFLPALLAIQRHSQWTCEFTGYGSKNVSNDSLTEVQKINQIAGALMTSSVVEIFVGGTGLVGFLLRFVGPITVAPTIALIGFSIYKVPINYAQSSWEMCFGTALLIVIFSLYLTVVKIPLPSFGKRARENKRSYLHLFMLFPVLLSICVVWIISAILTATNTLPNDPDHRRYNARSDSKVNLIHTSPWFLFPYPGQFGLPTFNVAVFVGFVAAFLASLIESIGDYFAAARACQVDAPPDHAVNRGILMEGLGGLLSGAVGIGFATTSYSPNIAAIPVTKTASRSVMVVTGVMMILFGVIGKFGAAIAAIPDPILGGALIIMASFLVSLGLSSLRFVNLNSSRNLMILGLALFVGIFLPEWTERNLDLIQTGSTEGDSALKVILGTPMFIGAIIAVVLDNTVRGSRQDRGIIAWREKSKGNNSAGTVTSAQAYSWFFIPACYRRLRCCRMIPFMPPLDEDEDEDEDTVPDVETVYSA